jgi:hypothetical protein
VKKRVVNQGEKVVRHERFHQTTIAYIMVLVVTVECIISFSYYCRKLADCFLFISCEVVSVVVGRTAAALTIVLRYK